MNQKCCRGCQYLDLNEMSDEMYCKLRDYEPIRLRWHKHRPNWCPLVKQKGGKKMTDTERRRIEAICDVANVKNIGDLSDGFHTFNELYEQRMILFAVLVKAYKDKAWKSYRHEDGEYCFGGGWFIVGIDTPEGSYTYHYENKYWGMFDCVDLPRAKHWDGHTEADAETRLMSLVQQEQRWIPCSERLPEKFGNYLISIHGEDEPDIGTINPNDKRGWSLCDANGFHWASDKKLIVTAWMPLPEPYKAESEEV